MAGLYQRPSSKKRTHARFSSSMATPGSVSGGPSLSARLLVEVPPLRRAERRRQHVATLQVLARSNKIEPMRPSAFSGAELPLGVFP